MARAKYQVLVLPYRRQGDTMLYCIFKRSDMNAWQFIAGGGETEDASPFISAKREANEEAGISFDAKFLALETTSSISTEGFKKARSLWGEDCLVIPEYCFAVEVPDGSVNLSHEHTNFEWVNYATAIQRLKYDSNKVALWELANKLKMGLVS